MIQRFVINKRVGETPLTALEKARRRKRIPPEVPMTYAGRLDPMASGKLLILVGDECKRQQDYHDLDKAYELEVLLGLHSDTGDILGIVGQGTAVDPSSKEIREVLERYRGRYRAPYPRYSSKTVHGKPLFAWALEGAQVEVPEQNGTIRQIRYRGKRRMHSEALRTYVRKKIGTLEPVTDASKARGRDFRKDEVIASWQRALTMPRTLPVIRVTVRTSAGVYMRTLAEDIARSLGTSGLALSIHRTRIFSV